MNKFPRIILIAIFIFPFFAGRGRCKQIGAQGALGPLSVISANQTGSAVLEPKDVLLLRSYSVWVH